MVVLVMAAGWGRSGMKEVLALALQEGGGGLLGEKKDLGTVLNCSNCVRLDQQFLKEQGLAPGLEKGSGPGLHNKHHLQPSLQEHQAQ